MQTVAQGWLVYDLSHRPFDLGLIGLSRAIPLVVFSLFGGAIADRVNKKRLLYLTQTLAAVFAAILGILTALHIVRVWHVVLLSFVSALVLAFDQPTRQAMLPGLVSREDLMNAISLNSMVFNGAALVGPMFAGLLIKAGLSIADVFYANAFSFGAVIWALWLMQLPPHLPSAGRSVLHDLGDGLQYVRQQGLLVALIVIASVSSFFGRSYVVLMPVFARDVLHSGLSGLATLTAAPGAGTIAGSILIASLGDVKRKGRLLLTFGGVWILLLLLFANSKLFTVSAIILVLVGAADAIVSATTMTLLQISTNDRFRGRVMSMFTLTVLGLMPLGQAPLGALAGVIGAPRSVTLGTIGVGVFFVGVLVFLPKLWTLEGAQSTTERP
jgi:MFS family permease